ncbi:MAG: hypothetical protein IJA10_13625 [Lachnospiraceae bacterium]|nr:hypothetical protein [Lachnospiraceae bacterium]
MKQLVQSTLYRVVKSTGIRVAVILTYFAAILYYVTANMVAKGDIAAEQAGSITGLGDAMILWLFGSLVIGILVGSDFENKTIHGAIGYGRKKIVINFITVFAVLMIILILPYTIGSLALLISGTDMTGAEGTVISAYMGNVLQFKDGDSIAKLMLSYVASAVVYIGQLSICIPVAIKVKKTVVVTAFGFFFGMMTALISTLASKVEILDNIYQLTPYHYGVSKLGVQAETSDMCMGIIVSILFTAICGVIAWLTFRKADIK